MLVHGFKSETEAATVVQQVQQLGRKSTFIKADLAETEGYEPFVETAWQWQQKGSRHTAQIVGAAPRRRSGLNRGPPQLQSSALGSKFGSS